ncbi:MAG: ABC transporter ATP-binding protein [Clostridium sp.]
MAFIELENIVRIYGDKNRVNALRSITLNIDNGELIAIVGPSGSGKSTLLNILGLLDECSSGNYRINGENIGGLSFSERAKLRNKNFGFVLQNAALINDYTVKENIEIPLEYAGISRRERRKKVLEVCNKLGIGDKIDAIGKDLSGGQAQRVAIGRAICNNPEIILADEPTGALDSKTGQEVINIFKELNNEGKTVIIVTHDEKIANQCTRIIRIEDGLCRDSGQQNMNY